MTSTNTKETAPPAGRRKNRIKILFVLGLNLILLLVIYAVFIGVTERYIAQQDASRLIYDYNPLRRQVLLPDQQYQLGDVHFSINELGIRGKAPLMPKPKEAVRIFAMGGSSAFDHHLSEGDSWAERLGLLLSLGSDVNVESFNCGIPGYSSRESLSFYIDKIRFLDPDYVLLYHGWNDLKYVVAFKDGVDADAFFYPTDYYDHNKMFKSGRPFRNWYALQAMYRDWRDSGAVQENQTKKKKNKKKRRDASRNADASSGEITETQVNQLKQKWLNSPGMDYFKRDVEMFIQAVQADDATPVLIAQNTLATRELSQRLRKKIGYRFVHIDHANLLAINEGMVDVLRSVADEYGIPFVDLREQLNGRAAYFRDHVHMSPEGSHAFSELLVARMAKVMHLEVPDSTTAGDYAQTSLIGHWPCDEILAGMTPDGGPSKLHGRVMGNTSLSRSGSKENALVFNGVDSEVIVENSASLHLDNSFFIETYVKLEAASIERKSMGLVIKGGEYYLALRHGKPAFFGYGLKPKGWQVASEAVPVDRWTRVAASYNGEILRLMIDDREVLAVPTSGRLDAIDSPLTIGGLNGFFLGEMDNISISRDASGGDQ